MLISELPCSAGKMCVLQVPSSSYIMGSKVQCIVLLCSPAVMTTVLLEPSVSCKLLVGWFKWHIIPESNIAILISFFRARHHDHLHCALANCVGMYGAWIGACVSTGGTTRPVVTRSGKPCVILWSSTFPGTHCFVALCLSCLQALVLRLDPPAGYLCSLASNSQQLALVCLCTVL